MNYAEALDWIHGLGRFGSKLGLERMKALMELLGHPHRQVPAVHIAGTNGKGSTAAMISSILTAAGYRTGLYISPYVEDFRERIQINGAKIGEEELAELAAELQGPVAEAARLTGEHPTEFEVVTAMMFAHFARQQVDVAVVEVGLGGRHDATNVIEAPLVAVITRVAMDHMDRLGNTLAQIAREKAGILKPGCRAVIGPNFPEALAVLLDEARALEVRVLRSEPAVRTSVSPRGQTVRLKVGNLDYGELFLSLIGDHQLENVATAVTAVQALNWGVGRSAVAEGLANVVWPARMEYAEAGNRRVLLDVAHNPNGADSLARSLQNIFPATPIVLVVGVLADKELDGMIAPLAPLVHKAVTTTPRSPRALNAASLAMALGRRGIEAVAEDDIEAAVERALALAGPEHLVVVTGSFYLVGLARTYLRRRGFPLR